MELATTPAMQVREFGLDFEKSLYELTLTSCQTSWGNDKKSENRLIWQINLSKQ
jgi:hypothetical protein